MSLSNGCISQRYLGQCVCVWVCLCVRVCRFMSASARVCLSLGYECYAATLT